MKKNQVIAVLGMLLLLIVSTTSPVLAKDKTDNPIDRAFASDFAEAMSTAELNYVAEKYWAAWKAELDNVAGVIKRQYKFTEDQKKVDAYIAAYGQVAAATGDLEWVNWSDRDESPETRWFGTGAVSARLLAEANIYKQATLNLIKIQYGLAGGSDGEGTYDYIYAGQGAELNKVNGSM